MLSEKYIITILLTLCLISCNTNTENTDNTKNEVETSISRPEFSSDSAYSYVKAQCAFGPRVPNSEAHKKCGNYLIKQFTRFCDTVYVQNFTAKAYDGTLLKSKNIIGVFNPQASKRIIIASHWDSRPYADNDPNEQNRRIPIDGANDGASGTGIMLEIARQLSLQKTEIGVDLICFDSEDYGAPQDERNQSNENFWCLGSQYWANKHHTALYRADFGILLDMVGGHKATFSKEGTSLYFAPDIINRIWNYAYKLGYSAYFIHNETPPITDDHLYVNQIAKIPMIDIIEYDPNSNSGFNSNWHTLKDNIENIDIETLQTVGEVVLYTIYNDQQ